MNYSPLKTMNPSDFDLTINSSIWLCSRLMPSRGNRVNSIPHFRVINNVGIRTVINGTITSIALVAVNDNSNIVSVNNFAHIMAWRGLWSANNYAVLGHCLGLSLAVPLNAFNVGQRYKRGWRPARFQ